MIYFGDNNIYVFLQGDDPLTLYLFGVCPYEYDKNEKKLIAKGANIVNSMDISLDGKINISDDKFMILSKEERYDLSIYNPYNEFTGTVVVANDDILAGFDDDDFNDELVHPAINSFTASYDSGTGKVTVNYNITAPGAETISSVSVSFVSPTFYEKYEISEENIINWEFPVHGQFSGYRGLNVTSGATVTGSGDFLLIAPENGIWHINKIMITTNIKTYTLTKEVTGNWESTYYVHDNVEDEYKNTGVATASFTVSGSTADTTAPTLTGISVDETNIKITFSGDCTQANIICIPQGQGGRSSSSSWKSGNSSTISGSTATVPFAYSGLYYIALIALVDAAGNSSVYFGYDTTVSFWSTDYGLGLDFSKYKRYWANEKLPEDTNVNVIKFKIAK